ncbi:MAG: phosphatase PAP2 family protein [Cyclobacteriaceae bacterium]
MKALILILLLVAIANASLCAQTIEADDGDHEQWEFVLEESGDILQLALPASAALISILKKDFEGTKKLAFSYGTTLVLTYSLKHLVHKQRPEGRNRFDSFPSGHTSSAFSGASFIQRRYGWGYGIPAYVLASIVGISRMEAPDGYHDKWDVLAGAAIGIGSTYLFTKPYEEPRLEMGLSASRDFKMLRVKYRF